MEKKKLLYEYGVQDVLIRYSFLKMKHFCVTSYSVTGAIKFAFVWHSNLLYILQFLYIFKLLLKKEENYRIVGFLILENLLEGYGISEEYVLAVTGRRLEWSERKTCLETQKC